MTVPRPTAPLVRTTVDLPVDRADRGLNGRLFTGWGADVPTNRIFQMHHIDVHIRDVAATRRLFDAVMPLVGYAKRSDDNGLVSYWKDAARPAIFFEEDDAAGSGMMRLAFAVASSAQVDAVAEAARANGARALEGPGIHPEYGDDYYAVFFEDGDGNKYEVVRAAAESGDGA